LIRSLADAAAYSCQNAAECIVRDRPASTPVMLRRQYDGHRRSSWSARIPTARSTRVSATADRAITISHPTGIGQTSGYDSCARAVDECFALMFGRTFFEDIRDRAHS
jgi:hypothetical protein